MGYQAYYHAFEVHPLQWYEHFRLRLFLAGITMPLLVHLQARLGIPPEIWTSIVGVGVCVICLMGDSLTTVMVMRLRPEFVRRGIEFPMQEQNRLLPRYPVLRDLVLSPTTLLALLSVPIIFFAPTVAIFLLIIEGGQAATNWRIWLRLKAALTVIDNGESYAKKHQSAAS